MISRRTRACLLKAWILPPEMLTREVPDDLCVLKVYPDGYSRIAHELNRIRLGPGLVLNNRIHQRDMRRYNRLRLQG